MSKERILAICVHNGGRSQMVEEYLRSFGGDLFDVESAGLEPGEIDPVVAALLKEDGIDISTKKTRSVFDLHRTGARFDYVIAVCSPDAYECCPVFPAEKKRLAWPFADPKEIPGSFEQRLELVRPIRDGIRDRVQAFVERYRKTRAAE